MKSCYFCKATKPSFAFPSNRNEVDVWCTMLGCEPPESSNARICQDHFNEESYSFNSRGHKRLKKGAKPMKISNHKYEHEESVFLISKENVKIRAHKSFIAATCTNLKPLLAASDDCDISIYFQGYSHRVIKSFLEALYCGSQIICSEIVEEMKEFLFEIGCSLLNIGNAHENNGKNVRADEAVDEVEEIGSNKEIDMMQIDFSSVVLEPRVKRSIMTMEGETEDSAINEKSIKIMRKYKITLCRNDSNTGRSL